MYEYKSEVTRVVDGDTVDAMIDLGFGIWIIRRVRLYGINTSETKTKDKEEEKKGLIAKKRVIDVLKKSNNKILLTSVGLDKYGRCLGEICLFDAKIESEKYSGNSVNKMLLAEGYAKENYGRNS